MSNLYIMLLIILIISKKCLGHIKNKFYYFPDKNTNYVKPHADIKDLYITTNNGNIIHTWYYKNPSNKYTVLFCHGNAGNLTYRRNIAFDLINIGYNFVIFDYCGFGKSTGSTFINSTYDDAESVFQYLVNIEKVNKDNIIPIGESIGSYPAAKLAETYKLPKLVILSGFHSISDVIKEIIVFPFGHILSIISNGDMDVGECLQKYNGNPLILHSKTDEIISYQNAVKNSQYGGKIVDIQGGHNTSVIDWGAVDTYMQSNVYI